MATDLCKRSEQAHVLSSCDPMTPTQKQTDAECRVIRIRHQLDKLDKLFREAGVFDVENRAASSVLFPDKLLQEFEPSMVDFKAKHAAMKLASANSRVQ